MGWQTNVFPLLIITAGPGFQGLFVYSPAPGTGNLIASVAAHAGTDPYGNAYQPGIVSYTSTAFSQMFGGNIIIGDSGAAGTPASLFSNDLTHNGTLAIASGLAALGFPQAEILLRDTASGTRSAQVAITTTTAGNPVTQALAEIVGTLAAARLDSAPAGTAPPARPSGTEPWNAATFANSWANAAGRTPLTFRLVAAPSACVQIRGGVVAPVGIAAGQTMFTLPAGYAPADLNSIIAVNVTTGALVRFAATVGGAVNFQSGAVAGDVIDIPAGTLVSLDA